MSSRKYSLWDDDFIVAALPPKTENPSLRTQRSEVWQSNSQLDNVIPNFCSGSTMHFTLTSPLWVYSGKDTWYFVTLPKEQADEINFFREGKRRGWGSLRVKAQIGKTSWSTCIFPDSKSGSHVLPIKADIRKREKLLDGQELRVTLDVLR